MRYLHTSLFATLGVCSLASCFSSTASPPLGMDASSAGDVAAPGEDASSSEFDGSRGHGLDPTTTNEDGSQPVDGGVQAATEAGVPEASVPEAGPLCGNGVIDPGETCD